MAKPPESAPGVYTAMKNGCFVGKRRAGSQNAVSPYMLVEQTYNDAIQNLVVWKD